MRQKARQLACAVSQAGVSAGGNESGEEGTGRACALSQDGLGRTLRGGGAGGGSGAQSAC